MTPNGIWKTLNAIENAASDPIASPDARVVATMNVSWLAASPKARGTMRRRAVRASGSSRPIVGL